MNTIQRAFFPLLLCCLTAGCGNNGNEAQLTDHDAGALTGKEFLYEQLPPGSTWEEVRGIIPGVGMPGPEGGYESLGAEGLTEAEAPVTVSGNPGVIEFNFRNGRLYSVFLRVSGVTEGTAAALADSLADIYAGRFGSGMAERQDEPGSNTLTRFWSSGGLDFMVSHGGMAERWFVSWGYQKTPVPARDE